MSLLTVSELAVYSGDQCLMAPISFAIEQGQRLTILGESGSGKSLIVKAIMGNLGKTLRQQGSVAVDGTPLSLAERQKLWGKQLSALPQEPWLALDPLMAAGQQLAQTFRWVAGERADVAQTSSQKTLDSLGLATAANKRVDQLSGGMAQRVAVACALAGGAPLLLADEPTKGLDVSKRDLIVSQLLERSADGALITITHDVEVAEQLGGQVMVIQNGALVEAGDSARIFAAPQHDYTKALIAANPKTWAPKRTEVAQQPLLSGEKLCIGRGQQELFTDFDISLQVGEVVGIVGDSGCGKSTLGDALLGLLPLRGGRVIKHSNSAAHRWQKLYQDPTAAVSTAVSLQRLLDDVITKYQVSQLTVAHLKKVLGLTDSLLARSAKAVSGGELQRFCLLRVLLLEPVFLFADEPTSRLDPITAKEVSELLVSLARETQCTVMLVSHDPYLIEKRCDRVIRLQGAGGQATAR